MVVLLAMAFELPIVSTCVYGIPEIVVDRQEALLVEPGDARAMASAMFSAISDPVESRLRAQRALSKLYRLFDCSRLNDHHVRLAAKVSSEGPRSSLMAT